MPYIGHGVTNAGTFYILDDLTMSSSTTYTMQVGGVSVTPKADNLLITLDGVVQHTPDAYTVSGSTITFASGPGSGVDFYGIIMGQSASTGQGSIGADELKVSGDGTSGQVLTSDGDGTFSWATDTENYLPLAGGTMSGAINLGSQNVTNGGTITGTFVGNITGNVTGNVSGTAAAGTLTGATLASGVTASSLTSVGTLTGLTLSGDINVNKANPTIMLNSASTQQANSGKIRMSEHATGVNDYFDIYHDGSANEFVIESDAKSDILKFARGSGDVTFAGQLKIDTDQRYFTKWETTYGTDRDYWWRNDGGLLQLGEGSEGDGNVKYTFDTANKRLGIGTNLPAMPLHINNSSGGRIMLHNTASSTGNQLGSIMFGANDGDTNLAMIASYQDGATDSAHIRFETEATGGSMAERMRILSGGGITFNGDTAAANALDDYEEGTWTARMYSQSPSRYYWNSDTTANYGAPTAQTCSYVKIGNTVTVWGNLTFTGTNVTSYDNIGIVDLPFNTVNRSGYVAVGNIFFSASALTSDASIRAGTMCQLGANTTHMAVGTTGTTSGSNYAGNFSVYMATVTGGTVSFKITYETAS